MYQRCSCVLIGWTRPNFVSGQVSCPLRSYVLADEKVDGNPILEMTLDQTCFASENKKLFIGSEDDLVYHLISDDWNGNDWEKVGWSWVDNFGGLLTMCIFGILLLVCTVYTLVLYFAMKAEGEI